MKWSIVTLAIISFLIQQNAEGFRFRRKFGPPPVGTPQLRAVDPDWGWIEQQVDHYNPKDTRTWQMRYLNNSQFYQEGGPIFIFLGGEWEITKGYLQTGTTFDLAAQHNGYLFYTEHRYYGQSYPTETVSVDDLQFLSADQALEDLAYFIKQKKSEIPGAENSKVVVAGGSYSATLATWARLKYPHLIDAAYSSSGPLRAVKDFYEYMEVVYTSIKQVSEQCVTIIEEGFAMTEELLETEAGAILTSVYFQTCNQIPVDDPVQKAYFFSDLGDLFAGLVQYARVGDLEEECGLLEGYDGTSLEKLASYIRSYLDEDECLESYDDFVEVLGSSSVQISKIEGGCKNFRWKTRTKLILKFSVRQWLYQSCTEYGFFQTTTSDNQPFGNTFSIDFFTQICGDLFGEEYKSIILDAGVERTNIVYGSDDPKLSNLVSIHGTVDPWHTLGLLVNKSDTVIAKLVEGTSHCQDLTSVSEDDIEDLREAKLLVLQLIGDWLDSDD